METDLLALLGVVDSGGLIAVSVGLVILFVILSLPIWGLRRDIEIPGEILAQAGEAAAQFDSFLDGCDYFNLHKLESWSRSHEDLRKEVEQFRRKKRRPSNWEQSLDDFCNYCDKGPQLREQYNSKYVQSELQMGESFFDTVAGYPLTEEQRVAVVTGEDNCYLNSGAGCGKTSTIIGRLAYLIQRKEVKPDQILTLAFNKSAAEEVRERLSSIGIEGVDVCTFHSFGLRVIGIARDRMPDIAFTDPGDSRDQFIDKTFKELTSENPRYQKRVTRYFTRYLVEHKPLEDFETLNDCLMYEKGGNLRAIDGGTYMKSQQEVAIADFLFEHSVKFEYERPYKFDTATAEYRQYRPDFYLPEYKIWLEHFAIKKGGSGGFFSIFKGYMDGYSWKKKLHAKHGTTLVSTFSYQFDDNTIWDHLEQTLVEHGVKLKEKPVEEMAQALLEERPQLVTKFTGLLSTFMSLMTSSGKNVDELKAGMLSFRNQAFLDILKPIHEVYRKELEARQAIDFADMIAEGARALAAVNCEAHYDHILVDEFQDIGVGRLNLVRGVIKQNPGCRVFCVGDDWQAIYRFAGGDVSILYDFEKYFRGGSKRLNLTRTFRYPEEVAEISNSFVLENPRQTRKTVDSGSSAPGCIETRIKPNKDDVRVIGDILEKASVVAKKEQRTISVLILNRYKFDRIFERYQRIKSRYAGRKELSIRFSTIHSLKGGESDYVIIDDINEGFTGFPNRLGEDSVLRMVQNNPEDFPDAEERRLFYVALTRCKEKLYLLSVRNKESGFLREIIDQLEGSHGRKICPNCGGRLMERENTRTNEKFRGCSNFPLCDGKKKKSRGSSGGKQKNRAGCPMCGHKHGGTLVERENRKQKNTFLGCSRYPQCKYTQNIGSSRRRRKRW